MTVAVMVGLALDRRRLTNHLEPSGTWLPDTAR
jgi:hypothetical protein